MIPVYGYGNNPHESGVLIATCPDDDYAADICAAMRMKYPLQWFGYTDHHGKEIKQRNSVETA